MVHIKIHGDICKGRRKCVCVTCAFGNKKFMCILSESGQEFSLKQMYLNLHLSYVKTVASNNDIMDDRLILLLHINWPTASIFVLKLQLEYKR